MKISIFIITCILYSCANKNTILEELKNEIINTEKVFEKMAEDKGIAGAFKYFSANNGDILRDNKIIKGRDEIFNYYSNAKLYKNGRLNWNADFIDVSVDGNIAYTYGKYIFTYINPQGDTISSEDIFQTVWKKQMDGNWKFV